MGRGDELGRRGFLAAGGTMVAAGYDGQGRASIDPKLAASSGWVRGIVRLDEVSLDGTRTQPAAVVGALKTHAATTQQRIVSYVRETQGIEIRRRFWLTNAVLITADTERASFADLAAIDGVDRVHRTAADTAGRPELEARGSNTQMNTQADGDVSYGLEMMNVPEVWEQAGTRGDGARIAVVDTGVDPTHPDIDLTAWAEFDADGGRVDSDPNDPNGHGTGMSSLATGGDASGTSIGVAPDADLLVAKQDPEDFFTSSIAALEWAVENDADVVSMSFDIGPFGREAIEPAASAVAAGTVVVPAGTGPEFFTAPGSFHHALSAGAVDRDATPYKGGNGGEIRTERFWRGVTGPEEWPERYTVPNVVTAGIDVLTAVPDNDRFDGGHMRADGYSNAPPHVSGVVALLRSLDADVSPDEIGRILTETAEQPGGPYEHPEANGDFGHGIVNAAAAAAELVGRDREVAGTVTDSDGDPVPGATVAAVTGDEARTDEQGRYTLSVPPGEATLTASGAGYDPVTRRVDPGDGRDLAFESERRPDIRRASRPPTHVAPSDTLSFEFAVEHAEFATVFVGDSVVPIDPSAVSARLDGDPIEIEEPANVEGETALRIEVEVAAGTRGLLSMGVYLANGEQNASLTLDPVHVHERPMRVDAGADLQAAVDAAAPGTTVALAGGEWDLAIESSESPLPESRYNSPIFEATRDDEAGLVVDERITLTAAEGTNPTLVATGGSGERRFGVQVTAHFATLRGVEVVAEGATAAVSVLDGDGVRLRDVDLSGADRGVHAQFTKSLDVRGSRISAATTGVALLDISINALVGETTIRDAEQGVFLSGRVGEQLFDVDADVTGNSFENVGTEVGTEGTATIRGEGGEERQVDGDPPTDSMLDLLLYAATAGAVGVLFYPYGRRRLG